MFSPFVHKSMELYIHSWQNLLLLGNLIVFITSYLTIIDPGQATTIAEVASASTFYHVWNSLWNLNPLNPYIFKTPYFDLKDFFKRNMLPFYNDSGFSI